MDKWNGKWKKFGQIRRHPRFLEAEETKLDEGQERKVENEIKKRRFFAATTKPWQRRIVARKEDRYSATNLERIALIRGEVGFVLSGRRGRKMEVTGQ